MISTEREWKWSCAKQICLFLFFKSTNEEFQYFNTVHPEVEGVGLPPYNL